MSVWDIIKIVNKKIKDSAPSISKEYDINWTDQSLELISKIISETLEKQSLSIESIAQREGINEYELERASKEILHEMFSQAKRSGRKEVLSEDFTTALISLRWPWPFCSSGERSGGISIRGP